MMKNRIITIGIGAAILFSLCTSCFSMAASAETITANTAPYLSEFFELPLTEIESNLNVSHTTANSNQIVVLVSNVQLKKLIGELEPQRDEIGKDAELFRIAFFDLLLDKLHLSGIYDAVVSEYLSTDMPSAWWDPMHPFDVEDCSDGSYACISLQYPENTQNPKDHLEEYTLQNGDTNVTVDRYELTQRSLYVILTYGDRAYFSDAYEEQIALSTTTAETTTAETTTAEAEKITDIEQIREMFTKFITDNELDAKCVSDEGYPQYAGTVVVEYNSETTANTAILEYAEKSNIVRTAFNLVPCVDEKPITTVNPDVENTTTTTTTTIEETEKITDIEQIRSMLIAFVEENGLDARIVSDKEYPGYRPIVVEYNLDAEINAWSVLRDYIEEQNIDKYNIDVVPIVDGKPITTATADVENTTTTTTTTTTDGTNTDLPQTGNNSVTNILISLAALLLTAAGAGIVYSSRILRRKKQDL